MKYVQPYGIAEPDAPYINGNPAAGIQGSIPPAAAFEHPMREITGVISKSQITPSEADLLQMLKAVRSQRANYAEDTGAVNTMIVAYDPPLGAYTIGLPLRIKVLRTNTSTVVTLDAGAGARNIKRMTGADPAVGDLPAGGVIEVTFDGTNWQLTNFGGAGTGGGTTTVTVNIPYCQDTGTVNAIVAPFSPAITSLAAGFACLVKLANTVTGPSTLKVNALPAKPVLASDGGPLLPSDIIAGNIVFFKFDGTNFIADVDIAVLTSFTVNVPSAGFPDVGSVMLALKRKLISPQATVTIQLAIGTYPPIGVSHMNGDRIIVKGTMKAAAPGPADFQATAIGVNNTDATANKLMLQARYGTEIQVSAANGGNFYFGAAAAIFNFGAGQPIFQDLLITGDYPAQPLTRSPVVVGAAARASQRITCRNVAVWGCVHGFHAEINGVIDAEQVYATANGGMGVYGHLGGAIRMRGSCVVQGNWTGACGTLGGRIMAFATPPGYTDGIFYVKFNGDSGICANDHGNVYFNNVTATNNGIDLLCFNVAEIGLGTPATIGTASPALNTVGGAAAYIAFPCGVMPNY
jgi:hypothetical protein